MTLQFKASLIILGIAVLGACSKENSNTNSGNVVLTAKSVSRVALNSASVAVDLSTEGKPSITAKGLCWSTSANPVFGPSNSTSEGTDLSSFASVINGLTDQTKYHVRAYAVIAGQVIYSNEIGFTNITPSLTHDFTVRTNAAYDVTSTSGNPGWAVLGDSLSTWVPIVAKGICWATHTNPTLTDSKINNPLYFIENAENLYGLSPETTYYFKAYAQDNETIVYGEELSFTTLAPLAFTMTTKEAQQVMGESAVVGFTVNITSGLIHYSEIGVCWAKHPSPDLTDSVTQGGYFYTGSYGFTAGPLDPYSTYYARAFFTDMTGVTQYADEVSFTTLDPFVVNVSTDAAAAISSMDIYCGGAFNASGSGYIVEEGVCLSQQEIPTRYNSYLYGVDPITMGFAVVGGVPNANTVTYYARAYVTDDAGRTHYGNIVKVKPH